MDTQSDKITPPGITTTAANQAQNALGDRPTTTTNKPDTRPGETQLTLQWYGNKGIAANFPKVKQVLMPVRCPRCRGSSSCNH